MSPRFSIGLCLLAAHAALASPASADAAPKPAAPKSKPTAPADAVAEHRSRGDKARLAGRCDDAITAYKEALDAADRLGVSLEKRAPILGDLGICEVTVGNYRDGSEHLHLSMRYMETFTPAQRSRIEKAQKEAEPHVVVVFIGANPPDAKVTFDGKPLAPRGPSYVVFADPGPHTVRASLEDHEDHVVEFNAPPGSEWPIVHLTPRRMQVPIAPRPVQVPIPPRDDLAAPRDDVAPKVRTVGFIAAGVGVAAGIGFTIAYAATNDRLVERSAELKPVLGPYTACSGDGRRKECTELLTMRAERSSYFIAAQGAFIAGGVIGALALSSFWWAPGEPAKDRPVQVSLSAAPKAGSAQVRWSW